MEVPVRRSTLVALAGLVRRRLSDVQDTLAPFWSPTRWARLDVRRSPEAVQATAKQVASVIVTAAAPYAPNSYARTRLIRQMHAAGLLSDVEADQAEQVLGVAE